MNEHSNGTPQEINKGPVINAEDQTGRGPKRAEKTLVPPEAELVRAAFDDAFSRANQAGYTVSHWYKNKTGYERPRRLSILSRILPKIQWVNSDTISSRIRLVDQEGASGGAIERNVELQSGDIRYVFGANDLGKDSEASAMMHIRGGQISDTGLSPRTQQSYDYADIANWVRAAHIEPIPDDQLRVIEQHEKALSTEQVARALQTRELPSGLN